MPNLKSTLMAIPGVRKLSIARTNMATRYFDVRHRVDTCGEAQLADLAVTGDNAAHGCHYEGTTPRSGRYMLRELPITDFSKYVFIDMGSGKGRMLLLAAELPFRRILGVEFASELNSVARRNVQTFRHSQQKCRDIEPLHLDATQFQFPKEPCVIYFYNPFDRIVLEKVIANLDASLETNPRDVILVFRNPEMTDVLQSAKYLETYALRDDFGSAWEIYRSVPASSQGQPGRRLSVVGN